MHSGKTITDPDHFSAGNELRALEKIANHPRPLKIVIPRAGIFVYEIVSNRGGRHDANYIEANEMDANVIMPAISWVLAEMVRFCADTDTATAMELTAELTEKRYPYFEEIDGRPYISRTGLRAGEIALLILYFIYPRRISRDDLIDSVARHGADRSAARSGVDRMKDQVDNANGQLQLRGIGRQKAETLLQKLSRPNS